MSDLFLREINKVKEELDPIKLEIMTGNISRILPVENEVNVDIAVNSMTFEESSRNLSRMVLRDKKLQQQEQFHQQKLGSSCFAPALKV